MSLPTEMLAADVASLAPEILLAVAGIVVLLLDAVLPKLERLWLPLSTAAVAAAGWVVWERADEVRTSFRGFLEWTPLTVFASGVVLVSALLALLASQSYLRREGILGGEYPALMLWCVVGLLLMLRSTELLTLFLSLELLSFCLYALSAFHRRLAVSTEAGLKYFLMGAFVSSFVLLGIALLYGETASTRLEDVVAAVGAGETNPVVVSLGFLFVFCGFVFKISAVPFHAWSPDTYQGAPTPFVAFLSVAPKAASAFVLIRILDGVADLGGAVDWPALVGGIAVLSMLVGNLLALVQKDVKRMLAYSGIAHMGYLLIPLVSVGSDAFPPVLLYLLAYALMNAGAFVIVGLLYARAGEQHLVSELSGWGYRFPLLGACLTICLLSLGGIPPTLGFLGKYLVFSHAIAHGHMGLALVGIFGSLVGIVYYLRVVYVLYMKPELEEPRNLLLDGWGRLSAVLAAGGTLVLGIFPARILGWLLDAASNL